jgi:hypothetical protein
LEAIMQTDYELGVISDKVLERETNEYLDALFAGDVQMEIDEAYKTIRVEAQIQDDAIDVMACANQSRYHTLNWLLNRMLTASLDDLPEMRDDFKRVLSEEAADYLARA